jgi:uncharacterized protein YfaS (alpha-2-macroglobulin family)
MKVRLWQAVTLLFWLVYAGAVFAQFDSDGAGEEKELRVIKVDPSGDDVRAARQIVITFNRPVVSIGKMDRKKEELPITVTPEPRCHWRWLNTSSLACQLDDKDALTPATRYEVEIRPGIKTLDGVSITEPFKESFITERPDLRYSSFSTWRSPGYPVIRAVFNQLVSKESVEQYLFLSLPGASKRLRVQAGPDEDYRESPEAIPGPNGSIVRNGDSDRRKADIIRDGRQEFRRIWLLSPEQELPLDTTVTLRVEPGLRSAEGPEIGVETRDIVTFDTFPEFRFLGVSCSNNNKEEVFVPSGDGAGEIPSEKRCNPLAPVSLRFSAPVLRSRAKQELVFKPDLAGGRSDLDPWSATEQYEHSLLSRPHKRGVDYGVNLPGALKAAQLYEISAKPRSASFYERIWFALLALFSKQSGTNLVDEFNRRLDKPIVIRFATDHRLPNFELVHNDAVLEKGVDSEVPLYVNNLQDFSFQYRSVRPSGVQDNQSLKALVPNVQDVQFAMPINVRTMLEGGSGAVYGHVATSPTVDKYSDEARRLFAQVTPFQMHVKLGHFSSLVWVSDMQSGSPVEGAKVTFYKDELSSIGEPRQILASSVSDRDGIAMLPGTASIDPDLTLSNRWYDRDTRLFVRADKAGDMAVMPIGYSFQINMYRATGETIFYNNRMQYGHLRAWGTTAQGIYRVGDTIQYKLYVRAQDDNTLIPAPLEGYTLSIIDPMGKRVHRVKGVKLNEFGGYSGEFAVGENAPVGWYQFKLVGKFGTGAAAADDTADDTDVDNSNTAGNEVEGDSGGEYYERSGVVTLSPMRVLVSDFTPVPFKVTNELYGDIFRSGSAVEVSTAAKLHSGGAYTQASARVTALLKRAPFTSKDPVASSFSFNNTSQEGEQIQLFQEIKELGDSGELKTSFVIPEQEIVYGQLLVESAVRDDRGKYIAAHSRAAFVGRDRFVGLRSTAWLSKAKEAATVEYLVVDERGTPVKGSPVKLVVEHEVTKGARVKGAGNAYLTNFKTEWQELSQCAGTSAGTPLACVFTPEEAGTYRVTATVKDTQGREHENQIKLWVVGSSYVLWRDDSDTALQIVPERSTYQVGDTARYLVKNPYPGAKALITVERYGVIDRFVQTLEGSTPVISLPIKPDYLPGVYLSVVVVSPRVDKPLENGVVDLGKPAFRMGYISVPIRDPYKELLVTAKTDREVYKPREKVSLSLHAEPRHADKREPIEFAVAVLDEAVFDLVAGGKGYYDPYAGLYSLEGLDLRNYSLLMRLVGRQSFEKKGANPGGDGGSDLSMRSLFKFVSYWNPTLKADRNGDASVTFDVPDNLTGWRVLAIAVTPTDRVGLGDYAFKVNRPTEVRPVMPNQVSEGDRFTAGFSVMNRTDKRRTLKVVIDAYGNLANSKSHHEESVALEPYKRATVSLPLVAGRVDGERDLVRDLVRGDIRFKVRASDVVDGDGMEHALPVLKLRSLEFAANYGTTTTDRIEEAIAFPEGIHTDRGAVSVVVAPSVIGGVEGAFRYMRDYPYGCWEQRLTKGVMASHYSDLRAYLPAGFKWEGSDQLPKSTLASAAGFQAPNGGMCYFTAADAYVDPYLSAYTALAFNWLRRSGHIPPESVEQKLHDYLLELLRRDVVPEFYSEGMSSTVRAVALAALAERGKVTGSDIVRYRQHIKKMSLFGKSHFMLAAILVGGQDEVVDETAKALLAHANETGGKFVFSEELDDSYSRILASPMRENCAILDVFTRLGETGKGVDLVRDLPFKLVRTITQTRAGREYWQNTQENMFCMNALINYSQRYEKVQPAMRVSAVMDGASFGGAAFNDLREPSVKFERPIRDGDAGRSTKVTIEREGDGRLYYATRLAYAPQSEFSTPTNAGIEIRREYAVEREGKWVLLGSPYEIRQGELVRIDLYLSLPAPRNFVAVDDPVPGGLEPVNRDLANSSLVDSQKGDFVAAGGSWWFKFKDWRTYGISRWSFYHQELRHNSARFYSDYLPAGNYHLSYTAQAIARGEYAVMPVLAQEMYEPDVFGKGVREQVVVGPD